MPAKNTQKIYVPGAFYHIYNQGVDNRQIFITSHDYQTFLSLLESYLSPPVAVDPNSPYKTERPYRRKRRQQMNLQKELKLLAYCLMPNHFDLLIRQETLTGMTKLMSRVCTAYSSYFNKTHLRTGTLFQGVYKAVLIPDKTQLLTLFRSIHSSPIKTSRLGPISTTAGSPANYPYSSYHWYVDPHPPIWLETSLGLSLRAQGLSLCV